MGEKKLVVSNVNLFQKERRKKCTKKYMFHRICDNCNKRTANKNNMIKKLKMSSKLLLPFFVFLQS